MNLLLDTHTLMGENDPNSAQIAISAIESPANAKFVSVISFWEIAIKVSLRKLILLKPLEQIIDEN